MVFDAIGHVLAYGTVYIWLQTHHNTPGAVCGPWFISCIVHGFQHASRLDCWSGDCAYTLRTVDCIQVRLGNGSPGARLQIRKSPPVAFYGHPSETLSIVALALYTTWSLSSSGPVFLVLVFSPEPLQPPIVMS